MDATIVISMALALSLSLIQVLVIVSMSESAQKENGKWKMETQELCSISGVLPRHTVVSFILVKLFGF
ncbi:hypothetical protein L3X38_021620 [Prunus dulcis]|uniref:Uncharacterized protein n=1 Tax=Prunus dulcis TaxID=3755 RepID=A0AAD4Z3T4_PRUDU|nr:hypothetical protein L3X38_021620 [Prunus dulcis]